MTVDISVIAVSWNTAACLPDALDAVPAACAPRSHEVIVVDNGSSDGSLAVLGPRRDAHLIALDHNTGFTHAANVGAAVATGRYLLFLNPDVLAPPGSVDALATRLEAWDSAWAATPWFRNPDGTPQHFWRTLPGLAEVALCFTHRGRRVDRMLGGRARRSHHYARLPDPPGDGPIGAAGAACLLVRRSEFDAAGRFDERYFNFFQDTDLMRRMARSGRELLGVGTVEVVHQLGVTFRRLDPLAVHGQFLLAFRQYLAGEPWPRRAVGELSVLADVLRRGERGRTLRRWVSGRNPDEI